VPLSKTHVSLAGAAATITRKIQSVPNPLKLASIWRVIADVDLQGIRRHALAPIDVWIVAEHGDDAAALQRLLSPDSPHPALRVVSPADIVKPLVDVPTATVLVTRSPVLDPALVGARNTVRAAGGLVMTVVVGATGPSASERQIDEDARVAIAAWDAGALAPIAATLLALYADDRRLALARQLPPLRGVLFDTIIRETAQANASFALTTGLAEVVPVLTAPLNLGDIAILTKNQMLLGYRIVLAAGRSGQPRELLGEIAGVLGSGLLFRQAARQLVGLIPVAGIVPKVAIAYSGTWAIGRALTAWVTEGRAVTSAAVRQMTIEGLDRGRAFADVLVEDARARGERAGRRWDRFRHYLPGRRRA
jgi:uncharacterized protein (DUF697 family)